MNNIEHRVKKLEETETIMGEPEIDLAERLRQGRKRLLDGTLKPPSAEECLEKAKQLRKTTRRGDRLGWRIIHAYERMAPIEAEEEARAQAADAKESADMTEQAD